MLELDYASLITFSVLVQCLFSIVYLSTYQWKRNKWLVLVYAIIFSMQFGVFTGIERLSFTQKLLIGNPGMVMGILPSWYLFTKELVSVRLKRRTVLIHFLPTFIFYILTLFYDETQPRVIIPAAFEGYFHPFSILQMVAFFIINILYGGLVLQLVRKNKKKYKDEYAESTIYLTLDWVKYLIIIIVSLSITAILTIALSQYSERAFIPFFMVELTILLIILATSYFAFRQPTLYKDASNQGAAEIETHSKIKAAKPLIDEEKILQISQALDQYLSEKQPFLNPKVRMPDIASAIEITPNELSWYLNEHKKTNFFAFINELRINHAVQLLENKEYEHYTLEALSKLSGFQSKTTFNNRFKEIKNVTPSAFRKSIGS